MMVIPHILVKLLTNKTEKMKKRITFLIILSLFTSNLFAQDCVSIGLGNHIFECDNTTSSINIPITFTPNGCTNYGLVFSTSTEQNVVTLPNWLTITSNNSSITVNCQANTTGVDRDSSLIFCKDAITNTVLGVIIVNQSSCQGWYPDEDNDGFGNQYASPVFSCTQPSATNGISWVSNNLDACPDEPHTTNNGCEAGYVFEDINWIMSKSFNINGNLKAASKSYFDALGKGIQTQTVDIETQKIWAAETFYDAQGRPAFQTLSAPTVPFSGNFSYNAGFVKKTDGTSYTEADFETNPESPAPVGNATNTLGYYYSENNTNTEYEGNSYQDITSYPFSRTIYSKLNPGATLKTIGGKQLDLNLETKNYRFSMPASQELSQVGAFNDPKYDTIKTIKTVVRNANGVETVVFTDSDGKTLAAARSGNEEIANTPRTMNIAIKKQGFVDIHIPIGITGITIVNPSNKPITIYNLITEAVETATPSNLPSGFYRVSITNLTNYQNDVVITYKENYYDYSLNEYDKAGRLIASYQPLNKLKSEFTYNSLGQLIYTKSPDEGEAWFAYTKSGKIGLSQNSKQKAVTPIQEYSYTKYDILDRPVESGVAISNDFSLTFHNVANGTAKKEQQFTTYDALEPTDLTFLTTLNVAYHHPTFLASNVAKTSNENTTTYYSYDVYGRVKWMVQNITGLGVKTIDYKYNPITGNVVEVDYQRHSPAERFIHKYTYNIVDQLVQVETSTDGSTFTNQAKYYYYETGALKRTELADNLQGIDYIYNLAGQLKAINHPSGNPVNDPGGDGAASGAHSNFSPDVFSMSLDYYTGDYTRTNTPTAIAKVTNGTDQYNGNIKAMTWKTHPLMTAPETYYYQYNKNNWLQSAGLNAPISGVGTPVDDLIINNQINQNGETTARNSITLTSGFEVASGIEYVAKIDPNATSNSDGGDYNVSNLTYDENGNIRSLSRNKQTENGSNEMDKLTYDYITNKNQLDHVTDAVTGTTNANDIKTQAAGNYVYNEIGQLIKNNEEGIIYEYNASGLVTNIKKITTAFPNGYPYVSFYYNDKGHRVRKRNWVDETDTYYVRDVSGNTLAVYSGSNLVEVPIYGASRIGVHYKATNKDVYQLTDHLGNVRAVIARSGNNATTSSSTDYYPFGMPMPGRQIVNGQPYRYAFQGHEKDPETGKEAFELRLWDGRIGRWLTTDPAGQYSSPYLGMGNNPLNGIDPDGAFFGWVRARWRQLWNGGDVYKDKNDKWVWKKTEFGEKGIGENNFDEIVVRYKNFGYGGFGKFTRTSSTWSLNGLVDVGASNFAYDTSIVGFSGKMQAEDLFSFNLGGTWENGGEYNSENEIFYRGKNYEYRGTTGRAVIETGIYGDYGIESRWNKNGSYGTQNDSPLNVVLGWTILRANFSKLTKEGVHFSIGAHEDVGAAFILGGSLEFKFLDNYEWKF